MEIYFFMRSPNKTRIRERGPQYVTLRLVRRSNHMDSISIMMKQNFKRQRFWMVAENVTEVCFCVREVSKFNFSNTCSNIFLDKRVIDFL